MKRLLAPCSFAALLGLGAAGAAAADYVETPYFRDAVAEGALPPVGERLPEHPARVRFEREEFGLEWNRENQGFTLANIISP